MKPKTTPKRTSSQKLADQIFRDEDVDQDAGMLSIPPEQRRLHTETLDFSIATIYDYLEKGSITIPDFQRNYVWSKIQASKLIESLIIQCPIPVIYLNQEKDETLSVIDGNQRLTSIKLFLEDGFKLKGLTAYPDLDGYTFSELDPRFQRHIQNRTLRVILILKETHPQIKMDVFERLNTGSVKLSAQELRHGIYHGPLIRLLDTLSQIDIWKNLFGKSADSRMRGNELILRFFALKHDFSRYEKPMEGFLNQFCERFRGIDDSTQTEWEAQFRHAVEIADVCLGSNAFRIPKKKNRPSAINAALFDAQMIAFSEMNIDSRAIGKELSKNIVMLSNNLFENPDFIRSISASTSDETFVRLRIDMYRDATLRALGN